jgi:hypothetical protein
MIRKCQGKRKGIPRPFTLTFARFTYILIMINFV